MNCLKRWRQKRWRLALRQLSFCPSSSHSVVRVSLVPLCWISSQCNTPQIQSQSYYYVLACTNSHWAILNGKCFCTLGNRSQKPVEVGGKAKGSSTAAATGSYSWEEDATREVNSAGERHRQVWYKNLWQKPIVESVKFIWCVFHVTRWNI